MTKGIIGIFLLLSNMASGSTALAVKDNTDVALTLSQNNYNRLVIRQDKIVEAVFPENAMAIQRDEQDGSAYVRLATTNPFTLFLTTKAGHHFSVTLTGEDSLGKTIELIPEAPKNMVAKAKQPRKTFKDNPALVLIQRMQTHEKSPDMTIRRVFGKAYRSGNGLSLLPKEVWEGQGVTGEILEIYNGGNKALTLSPSEFASEGVKAIALSAESILPKGRALLYRVGVSHG